MRDRAAGELEARIGGIVGCRAVGLATLVPASRDVRGAAARHRLHAPEQIVDHVAPVAQHVEDDAAAVALAVVPRRALRRRAAATGIALELLLDGLGAHRE